MFGDTYIVLINFTIVCELSIASLFGIKSNDTPLITYKQEYFDYL